ncbi:MAG TPA: amidohydrolase family protein [Verrucomicrobiae bacterium]|nr:amidohydrolase family protein [Verrucomicrobiae bacterium]
MKIVDTHQHLIYPDRFRYPWCGGLPTFEDQALRLEEYRAAANETGIEQTIFMEVDVDETQMKSEAEFFLQLASDPDSKIAGVVAAGRPERENFSEYLDSIQHPKLKGLRRVLHNQPDELSQSQLFAENLSRLAERNLTFDLCLLARQLDLAKTILRRAPKVQFILDHCGIPNVKDAELDPWRRQVRELANYPNLACKISGLVAYCDPQRVNAEAIRPFVEHCIDCFGWERVLFGGDWPVCNLTSTLRRWVEIAKEIFQTESADRQRQFFSENAERIYGLNES